MLLRLAFRSRRIVNSRVYRRRRSLALMQLKSSRFVLVALLALGLFGYFAWQKFGISWQDYPKITSPKEAVSAIRAVVKKDIRFIDVTVNSRPDSTIVIVAPANLPADAKATLEQIVRTHASGLKSNISY